MQLHVSHFWGGAKVDWTGLRHTNCATLCLYSEEVGPGRQECKVTLCHSLGLFYTVRFHCSSFYRLEFSLSLSFFFREVLIRPRGTIEQQCNTYRGHRSYQPIPNEVYRQIPKYRRHCMLGYAWEHFKKNFLLGFYWHPGECDWNFKLPYTINFGPSQKVSRCPDFSKLVSDLFCSRIMFEHLTTWNMTRRGYYHIVDMYLNMKIKGISSDGFI